MRAVNIVVPPDKSISHRAIMLASISGGTTYIKNLLIGDDCLLTIDAFRAMGVSIFYVIASEPSFAKASEGKLRERSNLKKGLLRRPDIFNVGAPRNDMSAADVVVHGVGMHGLKNPRRPVYLGNSGTTMRILPGILAGQDFEVVLKGDASLSRRPMLRIIAPLREMGAVIKGEDLVLDSAVPNSVRAKSRTYSALPCSNTIDVSPPLKIHGGRLKAIRYKSRIASAQVKSCILLAGLYAEGRTSVTEPVRSRDHTERMLRQFGVRCKVKGERCEVKGPATLKSPGRIEIPGDISSAAFFMVAGCILPDMKIVLENVGLNPTRTGVIDILKRMGADISLEHRASRNEPCGNIIVRSSRLRGVTISPCQVVRAIDEIPIIMVAASLAKGTTIIEGISELRVKETDRIRSMVTNLRKMGAEIEVLSLRGSKATEAISSVRVIARPEAEAISKRRLLRRFGARNDTHQRVSRGKGEIVIIHGGKPLHGARVSSYGDHRTAMSMLIAGLVSRGKVSVRGLECINKSFPNFLQNVQLFCIDKDRAVW